MYNEINLRSIVSLQTLSGSSNVLHLYLNGSISLLSEITNITRTPYDIESAAVFLSGCQDTAF